MVNKEDDINTLVTHVPLHPRHLCIVDECFMLCLKAKSNEWADEIEPVGEDQIGIAKNGNCS